VAAHLGTEHTELYVTAAEARGLISRLPQLYDEPFADSSQIPTFLVSQLARQHVTVSLSGDGGDELFGGYNRYFWAERVWRNVEWMPEPVRKVAGHAITSVPATGWDRMQASFSGLMPRRLRVAQLGDKLHKLAERMNTVRDVDDLYRSLVSEWKNPAEIVIGADEPATVVDDPAAWPSGLSPEERMMYLDTLTYLPDDILAKVDRAAMGVSLESRVPLLDHRVVELAWRLPLRMKIRDGQGKWVLRQVLYRHVPRSLIERPKMGFGIPLGSWLRGPLAEWVDALLDPAKLAQQGFLRPQPIRKAWEEHRSGQRDWQMKLWNVLMFQAWLGEAA
jgi:asparagine synthase (glutamine-hydrolysing)